MFNNIGTTEILILLLVLIILFGGNKINEVAKGLGEATKEVKRAKKEVESTKQELAKEAVISDDKPEPKVVKKKKRHLKKNKK